MDFFATGPGAAHAPTTHITSPSAATLPPWCVLLVDDDPEIHDVTRLALRKFEFQRRGLELLSVHSAAAAQAAFRQRPDIAVAVIDVVMETEHAGLELVRWLRASGLCPLTRLVLRTGQAGRAPEEQVIREFDIDAYREKTELTSLKLRSVLYSTLRNHQVLRDAQLETQRLIGWMSEVLPALRQSANNDEAEQCLRAQLSRHFPDHSLPPDGWPGGSAAGRPPGVGPETDRLLHACLLAAMAAWPDNLAPPHSTRPS